MKRLKVFAFAVCWQAPWETDTYYPYSFKVSSLGMGYFLLQATVVKHI